MGSAAGLKTALLADSGHCGHRQETRWLLDFHRQAIVQERR